MISQMYLKKSYFFAWGRRQKDLLITHGRRLHAGCPFTETLQLSASCTLAGSSVFKKGFLETLVSPFPRPRALTMWKPHYTLTMLLLMMQTHTAVMLTRQGPTSFYHLLSFRTKSERLFNCTNTHISFGTVLMWLNLKLFQNLFEMPFQKTKTNFSQTASVDEAVKVNTFKGP